MAENRAVVDQGSWTVNLEDVGFPKMLAKGRPVTYGVILKVLISNICGSDLHIYRGRTDMTPGTSLGHEMTGVLLATAAIGFDPVLATYGATPIPGTTNSVWNQLKAALPGQGIQPILMENVKPTKDTYEPLPQNVPLATTMALG